MLAQVPTGVPVPAPRSASSRRLARPGSVSTPTRSRSTVRRVLSVSQAQLRARCAWPVRNAWSPASWLSKMRATSWSKAVAARSDMLRRPLRTNPRRQPRHCGGMTAARPASVVTGWAGRLRIRLVPQPPRLGLPALCFVTLWDAHFPGDSVPGGAATAAASLSPMIESGRRKGQSRPYQSLGAWTSPSARWNRCSRRISG